jgi:chemotaxis signal transduction protein
MSERSGGTPAGAGVIVVQLGPADFGLPIEHVREVLRTPTISRVPFPPPAVCGAVALRGSVIPVFDLGIRLFERPAKRPGALVIVQPERFNERVAVLVDGLVGLLEPDAAEVLETPAEGAATLPAGWVSGLWLPQSRRPVTVLDLGSVLGGNAVAASTSELLDDSSQDQE